MSTCSHVTEMCDGHNGSQSQHEQQAAAHRNQKAPFMAGGWHIMLAQLIVALRSCLSAEELALFDRVHASAHRKEIPIGKFLVFALDVIRNSAPHLEGGFRHVFMLRTASRRRSMQNGRTSAPCSRTDDAARTSGGAQNSDKTDELVDEALKRFSGMCVGDSNAPVDRKRQSDEPMEESWNRNRSHFMSSRVN
eukprot:3695137-Rhodomonas_salina.1